MVAIPICWEKHAFGWALIWMLYLLGSWRIEEPLFLAETNSGLFRNKDNRRTSPLSVITNLVPRSLPCPVFDHIQYANMREKACEIWSHAMMSSREIVDTWGVVIIINCNISCFVSTCPWHHEQQTVLYGSQPSDRHYKKGFVGHCPPCGLPDITTCDWISQSFPLCTHILQLVKDLKWELPGNETN